MTTLVTASPACNLPSASLDCTTVDAILTMGNNAHAVVTVDDPKLPPAIKQLCSTVGVPLVYDAATLANEHAAAVAVDVSSVWKPARAQLLAVKASKLNDGLNDEQLAIATALSELLERVLVAIEYLAVEGGDFKDVDDASFWTCLVHGGPGPARAQRLDALQAAGRFTGVAGAWEILEKLHAVEKLLVVAQRNQHQQHPQTPAFIFATAKPTAVDALAFAALSALAYGKFSAVSSLCGFQSQVFGDGSTDGGLGTRVRLPLCLKYVRHLKQTFFSTSTSQDAAPRFVEIKNFNNADSNGSGGANNDDLYAEGRTATLVAVAASCVAFVFIANLDLVLRKQQ